MVTYMRPPLKIKQEFETNTITAILIDDEEKEFEVKITYECFIYCGARENETVVTSYDYKMDDQPRILRNDLLQWVENEIKMTEPRTVTFNI